MGTPLNWIAFNLFIVIAIALDLRVFHRHEGELSSRSLFPVRFVPLRTG